MPMANTSDFLILALDRENICRQLTIQVKTAGKKNTKWVLSHKNEDVKSLNENVFYVFVWLNDLEKPDYYVAPGKIVTEEITSRYKE